MTHRILKTHKDTLRVLLLFTFLVVGTLAFVGSRAGSGIPTDRSIMLSPSLRTFLKTTDIRHPAVFVRLSGDPAFEHQLQLLLENSSYFAGPSISIVVLEADGSFHRLSSAAVKQRLGPVSWASLLPADGIVGITLSGGYLKVKVPLTEDKLAALFEVLSQSESPEVYTFKFEGEVSDWLIRSATRTRPDFAGKDVGVALFPTLCVTCSSWESIQTIRRDAMESGTPWVVGLPADYTDLIESLRSVPSVVIEAIDAREAPLRRFMALNSILRGDAFLLLPTGTNGR